MTDAEGENFERVQSVMTRAQREQLFDTPDTSSWLTGWSKEEIRDGQLNDPKIAPLLNWREQNEQRPQWEMVAPHGEAVKFLWGEWNQLRVKDGVLYKRWENNAGLEIRWQLLVPESLKKQAFHYAHDVPISGHLGVTRTLARMWLRFHWHKLRQDVQDWCRQCDRCASRKPPQPRPHGAMQNYRVGVPMERVAMDIAGPYPVSDNGNRYMLVISDYLTRWLEAYPIPDTTAKTVAEKVVAEFVCRFGTPRIIHTDQGSNF
jgi:hypothetical protein